MLRLIVILILAFAGSRFPTYYQNYVMRLDWDIRTATQAGAPAATLDAMKQQRLALLHAEPTEWPLALLDAWDTERAVATLDADYSPRLPANDVEWAYAGVGLVLGFVVTGILFAPFRHRAPVTGRPQVQARRPAARAAVAPPAEAAAPWGPRPGQPASVSARAASGSGSLKQAADRLKQAARQMADAAAVQAQQRRSQPAARQEGRAPGPRNGHQAVETRHRPTEVIVFARSREEDAVSMSYPRPPLIARRRALAGNGPVDRTTVLRD